MDKNAKLGLRFCIFDKLSADIHILVWSHTLNSKGLYTTLLFNSSAIQFNSSEFNSKCYGDAMRVKYMDIGWMKTNKSRYMCSDIILNFFWNVAYLRKTVPVFVKELLRLMWNYVRYYIILYQFLWQIVFGFNLHLGSYSRLKIITAEWASNRV